MAVGNRVKLSFLFLFVFLLLLFVPSVFAAPETIRVGFYENPPKMFIGDDGKISGFWPDLISAIAENEGWDIEYVHGTWEECLDRLRKGEIDMMPDVAFSDERDFSLDFNQETVFVNWASVFMGKNVDVQSWLDLNDRRIAVMEDSIHTTGAHGIISMIQSFEMEVEYIFVSNYKEVFELLESGAADVGVVSRSYQVFAKDYDIRESPIVFNPVQLKFAFPKGSNFAQRLIPRLDEELRVMKADQNSAYHRSLIRYMIGNVSIVEKIPVWLFALIVGSIPVILVLIVSSLLYRRQRNELKKANLLKSLFIDIVRHDLLNPAMVLQMTVQLLLRDCKDLNSKKNLKQADHACHNLIDRIKDASLLSRLEEGVEKLEFGKVNLKDTVNAVLKETSHLARKRGIRVLFEAKGKFFVSATPLVFDLLSNLMINAIRYSPRKSLITVSIVRRKNHCLVSIADEGEGIPDNYKKAIFERTRQLRKGVIKGTGLGLTIVRKIAEVHKARVWVEDNKPAGSVFYVEFPLIGYCITPGK